MACLEETEWDMIMLWELRGREGREICSTSFLPGWFTIWPLLVGGVVQHGAHTEITHMLKRPQCSLCKECPRYNTYWYSESDSAFQVPVFLQWFKRAICMNDSGRIRISASSSAFLFKRNFTVKVLLCSNLPVMKRFIFEFRNPETYGECESWPAIKSDWFRFGLSIKWQRNFNLFYYYYFILSLGLHRNIITPLTMPVTADLHP